MPKYTIEFEDEHQAVDLLCARDRASDSRAALTDIHKLSRALNKHGGDLAEFQSAMEDIQSMAFESEQITNDTPSVWATPIFILSLTIAFLLGGLLVLLISMA